MATTEKANVFNQLSIAAQIIDGSIKIDSTTEFENILQIFPDDPALLRAYGDLLMLKSKPDAAAETFGKAARLFIDSGMMLQAIVSKSLQWKIKPPADSSEIRQFFSEVKRAAYQETAVNAFFHTLEYQALVAILFPLVKIRLPAGRIVKKAGDDEKHLYLIVSGALRATNYLPVETNGDTVYKKSAIHLSENDFFGAVYPFEDQQLSKSYVETITQAELIKIPKINLMKVCVKHPQVEKALIDLLGAQSGIEEKEELLIDRIGDRQEIPVKVHLQIHPQSKNEQPLSVSGYSKDISIGGLCVVLNSEYRSIPSFKDYVKEAGVQITLPAGGLSLNVKGTVIWSRRVKMGANTTVALGMRFQEMSPKSRGMLLGFANNLEKLEGVNDHPQSG
ncbi:MAG: PilZ domain-containing protein [Deltaproteobacteria bacterium]|jgi:CRP-like cAMP-binding protein|nr:PilZ domain-containing protein [Deltaproteobacteria bacterium]